MTAPTLPTPATTTTTKATTTTTKANVDVNCNDINMLVESNTAISSDGAAFYYDNNGALVINSTNSTGGISIVGPGSYDAATYKWAHISINSDVPYVVAFYDAANARWMTSSGDFFPDFETSYDTPVAKGAKTLSLWTNGCYTWDGSALPADVQMSSIYIEPKGAGTIIINHLALSNDETCTVTPAQIPTVTVTATTTTRTNPDNPDVTFSLSNVEANVGDIITVDVMVSENHYMVNGQIWVEYDPNALEIQKVWDDEDNPYFEDYNTQIFKNTYMWAFKVPMPGYANFAFASSSSVNVFPGCVTLFII